MFPTPKKQNLIELFDESDEYFYYGCSRYPVCSLLFHPESPYQLDCQSSWLECVATDIHCIRKNFKEYECLFCGKVGSQKEVLEHINKKHRNEQESMLNEHTNTFDDEDLCCSCIYTKCLFSDKTNNKKDYSNKRENSGNIAAYIITDQDESEDVLEESKESNDAIEDDFKRINDLMVSVDDVYLKKSEPVPTKEPVVKNVSRNARVAKTSKKDIPVVVETKKEDKEPVKTSYLSNIPSGIVEKVLQSATNDIIHDILEQFLLKKCKDQKLVYSKRIKEENRQKLLEEQKRKQEELRNKKTLFVQSVLNLISGTIINYMTRNEIASICEELKQEKKSSRVNTSKESLKHVVLSGLYSPKYLTRQFIYRTFSNLKFRLDKHKEPKIRFRKGSQRTEVLLYLTDDDEIRKALDMQVTVDGSRINIELDIEQNDPKLIETITKQQALISDKVPYFNSAKLDKGLSSFISISPHCNLESLEDNNL